MASYVDVLKNRLQERIGSASPVEAIRNACSHLLDEASQKRPPIRLSKLARHLGAVILYDDCMRVGKEEASLKILDKEFVLWVSKEKFETSSTRARARFSIAHEIGHLMLYKLLGSDILDISEADAAAYRFTEHLCDVAASCILMPRSEVSLGMRERSFTYYGVKELSFIFDVSMPAMLNSISDLAPKGRIVEIRKYRQKPSEEKMWRVWATYSGSIEDDQETWLPRGYGAKHICGLGEINTLKINKPQARKAIVISRSKGNLVRDAAVCKWPVHRNTQSYLSKRYLNKYEDADFDCDANRIMLMLGEQKRVDFKMLGAEV